MSTENHLHNNGRNWVFDCIPYYSDFKVTGTRWVYGKLKQQQTPPVSNKNLQNWIIWRNVERLTEFSSLNECEYIMLEGIIQGLNYAGLCEQLAKQIPINHVRESSLHCLINWLNQGITRSLSVEPEAVTLKN